MGPSQSQMRLLSPEDRILYKKWLRRGLLVYGSAMALLVLVTVATHMIAAAPSDIAGELMRAAAITSRK